MIRSPPHLNNDYTIDIHGIDFTVHNDETY